jgi:hypothetical protein
MLSSVPLPRLLEGIAASLRTNVAPHVDDRFATMQLRAIDELLRNLAGRVEWKLEDVTAEVVELETLLATLAQAGWPDDPPAAPTPAVPISVEAALTRREAALARLRDGIAWVLAQPPGDARTDEARAATVAYLRAGNVREREQLQSGMYG